MAKQSSTDRPGCSYPPPPKDRDSNPRRRRRRKLSPSSLSRPTTPSPALLSFLAAIAASSTTAHGSPAPLPFLCPPFIQNPPVQNGGTRGTPSSQFVSFSPDPVINYAGIPRHVPDKYERGDDGRWRRVDAYTLYGSTVCPTCREPTNAVTSVDDQIQGPPSNSDDVFPSSTPSYDIRDTLPPGWKPPTAIAGSRTTIILALSLVLAFMICFLIIGCLFWRKTQHRKYRQGDVEMKPPKKRRAPSAAEEAASLAEKEARAKQKIWARATARWKAGVRLSARQRKGKRTTTNRTSQAQASSSTSIDCRQDLSLNASTSSPPSRSPSPRLSIESLYASSAPGEPAPIDSISEQEESRSRRSAPSASSLHKHPPTSPPAYHQRAAIPRLLNSADPVLDTGDGHSFPTSISTDHTPQLSSSIYSSFDPMDTSRGLEPRPLPLHAAHVATDDKNLLARLAELASSPPSDTPDLSHGESSSPEASVPVWQDEELEDFRDHPYDPGRSISSASNRPSRSPSPVLPFPPPPSKGKMAAPAFYDYPYTFEDMALEPEPGPSAPPFEEGPSAPPIDGIDLLPSAPPLLEDMYYLESSISVRSFSSEPMPRVLPLREAGEERTCHQEDTLPTNHQREPHAFRLSSDPPVQGPVSSDGTPPSYHP